MSSKSEWLQKKKDEASRLRAAADEDPEVSVSDVNVIDATADVKSNPVLDDCRKSQAFDAATSAALRLHAQKKRRSVVDAYGSSAAAVAVEASYDPLPDDLFPGAKGLSMVRMRNGLNQYSTSKKCFLSVH